MMLNHYDILKRFSSKSNLKWKYVNFKKNWLSFGVLSQDSLTLEGSCLVQYFCFQQQTCGKCCCRLLCGPGCVPSPCSCPPDGPYYEGCAAPLIIKLENIFSQVIKFDLQKMLTLFEIQTGLKKNVLSALYSGSVNCFWSLSVLLVFFNKE